MPSHAYYAKEKALIAQGFFDFALDRYSGEVSVNVALSP
jgi:hypothetical protein